MQIDDVRVGMRVSGPFGDGTVVGLDDGIVWYIAHADGIKYWCTPPEILVAGSGAYSSLRSILDEALTRASEGKGKDRHANGKPFDEQPIVSLNLSLWSQDGPLFQIQKKCAEASRFYASGERERAENELLDCIVYAAGAIITGRRRE